MESSTSLVDFPEFQLHSLALFSTFFSRPKVEARHKSHHRTHFSRNLIAISKSFKRSLKIHIYPYIDLFCVVLFCFVLGQFVLFCLAVVCAVHKTQQAFGSRRFTSLPGRQICGLHFEDHFFGSKDMTWQSLKYVTVTVTVGLKDVWFLLIFDLLHDLTIWSVTREMIEINLNII